MNLAKEFQNISKACKMGVSRDTLYCYQELIENRQFSFFMSLPITILDSNNFSFLGLSTEQGFLRISNLYYIKLSSLTVISVRIPIYNNPFFISNKSYFAY